MSLRTERDHYRRMATAHHKPDCVPVKQPTRHRMASSTVSASTGGTQQPCPGCITDDERDLFARLADEIDRHLGEA